MKRELIYRTDAMAAIGNLKGLSDTDKSKAMQAVLSVPGMPQPEEDCDTCKHGFFGSRQCDNCRMRYPSHYESIAVPSVQPEPEWNNHTVACLLAELFGDTCACNYNGIDEWLPEKCEVIDACPNPVGVACWEQFLKHRAERIQP